MDQPIGIAEAEWLDPWEACSNPGPFEAELARELAPGHALYGRPARCVGRRFDCDDVLLFLPDGPQPYAVVHLTWAGQREHDTRWPSTRLYSSLAAWIRDCMRPDHDEYGPDEDDE